MAVIWFEVVHLFTRLFTQSNKNFLAHGITHYLVVRLAGKRSVKNNIGTKKFEHYNFE